MTALLLLCPGTPMLFQGQEFSASAPFLYFADLEPELAAAVRKGRARVPDAVSEHRRLRAATARSTIPATPATFERCKLDFDERDDARRGLRAAPRSAALRREDAAFRAQRPDGVDGAVLSRAGVRAAVLHDDHARRSPADRQPRRAICARRRSPSRCWRRRPARDWTLQLVERRSGVRRRRHAAICGRDGRWRDSRRERARARARATRGRARRCRSGRRTA